MSPKTVSRRFLSIGLAVSAGLPAAQSHAFLDSLFKKQAGDHKEVGWSVLVPEEAYDFLNDIINNEDAWADGKLDKQIDIADRTVVKAMDGEAISIPGYMVPLEYSDDLETVQEFMLVPFAGACIHVPPPPPNQTILAKAKSPIKLRGLYQPVLLKGRLKVETFKVEFEDTGYTAESGYTISVDRLEDYEDEE